jgi:tetratricopeptide (TPR) repeat protein
MTIIRSTILTLFFAAFLIPSFGQSLEEDNNVVFMKANVLYESSRYDEAVRMYNRILRDDPAFSRALFMRGKCKFALSAFKGTKSDLLEYINLEGIDEELLELMANTELKLENSSAALSYFEVLVQMRPFEGDNFAKAGELKFASGDKNAACEYWIQGAKLGNGDAIKQASTRCAYNHSIELPAKMDKNAKVKNEESGEMSNPTAEIDESETIVEDDIFFDEHDESNSTSSENEQISDSDMPIIPVVDLESRQDLKIDDELSIVITQGLGDRKVDDYPDILMLSDQSGKVVINLCVNAEGKVTTSELNDKETTLFRSSLSSLALRKAREFRFMPSLQEEQCGQLIFVIDTDG